jgi:hypothetical protein
MFKKRAQVLQKRIHTELENSETGNDVDLIEKLDSERIKKKQGVKMNLDASTSLPNSI